MKREVLVGKSESKEVSLTKELNAEGKEIITELKTVKTTDIKNVNNEVELESIFYYEVNKESELFLGSRVSTVVLTINHLTPIDYKKFHEETMIISWALDMMGYDMIKDQVEWREKLKEDDVWSERLGEFLDTLIPITKEQYEKLTSVEEA